MLTIADKMNLRIIARASECGLSCHINNPVVDEHFRFFREVQAKRLPLRLKGKKASFSLGCWMAWNAPAGYSIAVDTAFQEMFCLEFFKLFGQATAEHEGEMNWIREHGTATEHDDGSVTAI